MRRILKIKEGLLDAKVKIWNYSQQIQSSSKTAFRGALDCIKRHSGNAENIDVVWIPGSVETVFAFQKWAER